MLTCKANGKFREKLSEISGAWMANACGLESAYIDFTTSRLANLKVPIVEFAHTPPRKTARLLRRRWRYFYE